jgi:heterodisulfide reductase subunit A-like polyferredoxin
VDEVNAIDNIQVHLNTELASVDGFVGNFKSTLPKTAIPEHRD